MKRSRTWSPTNIYDDVDGFADYCKEQLVDEHAILVVSFQDPNVLQIVKSVKFTFADRLGIAGGTIGLFTGLSLLSIVELVYWFFIWAMESFKKWTSGGSNGACFGIL